MGQSTSQVYWPAEIFGSSQLVIIRTANRSCSKMGAHISGSRMAMLRCCSFINWFMSSFFVSFFSRLFSFRWIKRCINWPFGEDGPVPSCWLLKPSKWPSSSSEHSIRLPGPKWMVRWLADNKRGSGKTYNSNSGSRSLNQRTFTLQNIVFPILNI